MLPSPGVGSCVREQNEAVTDAAGCVTVTRSWSLSPPGAMRSPAAELLLAALLLLEVSQPGCDCFHGEDVAGPPGHPHL